MKTFARSGDNSFTFGMTSDCSVMGGGDLDRDVKMTTKARQLYSCVNLTMKLYTSSLHDFVNDSC